MKRRLYQMTQVEADWINRGGRSQESVDQFWQELAHKMDFSLFSIQPVKAEDIDHVIEKGWFMAEPLHDTRSCHIPTVEETGLPG